MVESWLNITPRYARWNMVSSPKTMFTSKTRNSPS